MARSPRMPDDDAEAWPDPPVRRGSTRTQHAEPERAETFISWRSLVIGAVVAVAVAIGGIYVARTMANDEDAALAGTDGQPPLIRAPDQPWRERPADAGGRTIEGTDRALYDAGQGDDPIGEIALDAAPVEPEARDVPAAPPRDLLAQTGNPEAGDVAVIDPPSPEPAPMPPAPARTATVARTETTPPPTSPARTAGERTQVAAAPGPVPAPATPAADTAGAAVPAAAGPLLQLGAFSSREAARDAWGTFSGRFSYLAGLEPVFERVDRNGQTLWRLKARGTGSVARTRGRAGEDCLVVGG